jgi:hypothetical protein
MSPARIQLIGLDKPSAPPLRGAGDPLLMLRTQASAHERNRLESVAEILALIAILMMKKVLTGLERVTVRGAVFQWGKGVRVDGTVAAHCLPGQLRFNDTALDDRTDWTANFLEQHGLKPLPLGAKLKNLGARTDVADQAINNTDSLLEITDRGQGLKTRFEGATQQLITRGFYETARGPVQLIELVRGATNHYRLGATLTCEERWDWLKLQMKTGAPEPELDRRRRQVVVLEEYLKILRERSFIPYFETRSGFEELFREVVRPQA